MTDDTGVDSLPGQQLNEYRLQKLLGKGGMARVYRGFDIRLKRWAAIKVINVSLRSNPDYADRFRREARAIAQLKHPHIVGIYRYGEAAGLHYIAMEYVEGTDLAAVLAAYRHEQGFIPPHEAGRIMGQVCRALDYAHSKGVIHRDIKPSNVMVDKQGNGIITDFGLALLDDKTRGEILGTPYYVAPEQAISSANAGPQSDLYSVGVILYEMFTGKLPFDAAHPHDVTMQHLTEPPPPPRALNPDISSKLEAVLLKALAKEPENRYPDGAALAEALDQALPAAPAKVSAADPGPASGRSDSETPSPVAVLASKRSHPKKGDLVTSRYILLKNIRAMLTELIEGLSKSEVLGFFSAVPHFKPVQEQLAQSRNRAEIVERLLDYVDQALQTDQLLALAKKQDPAIYEKHQPYYELVKTSTGDLIGANLGKYHVVELLGQGGMAEIYKAYQAGLARYVAIKVIHSYLTDNEGFLERFEREAMGVARLHHPNIVQVFDFDREDDLYYMVMEFIDGPTLRAELDVRREQGQLFPLAETVRIVTTLAGAIDYAHSRGTIHRDLKPPNIMFTARRRVVLTDFGIARIRSAPSYTRTRAVFGTPAYMSPEQARGEQVDERSDIYSLGVLLYELATGRLPFEAENPVVIMMNLESGNWPPPTALNQKLPPAVDQVVLKAMSRIPAQRFQSAGELGQALQKAVRPADASKSPRPRSDKRGVTAIFDPAAAGQPGQAKGQSIAKQPPPKESQPPPRLRFKLVSSGQEIVTVGQAELTIGRTHREVAPDIDLGPYGDPKAGVSRRHCRLLYRDSRWFVEDLTSTNGTFVNDIKVDPHEPVALKIGDILRCGQIALELKGG